LVITICFCSCSSSNWPSHNYYSSVQPERTIKEKVLCFVSYIATEEEKEIMESMDDDIELNDYLVEFWTKRDPDPDTEINEFKEEYVERFKFANSYLGGWQTDRGRVYILRGAPVELLRFPMNQLLPYVYRNLEIWIYDEFITKPEIPNLFMDIEPTRVKFVFADRMDFGVKEQIYSTEANEKIDLRVLSRQLKTSN
jgi:GWxTD domain-containing protein